ncbi:hypothetical protein GIB67_005674 [Kingdonia uniflora]|uniref:NADP-dependent oxidoreductase domain-containing protein n=1 Tax=Kingdonia uniflora TaxID=39325 RepID=A0A7J7NIR8_9MAGN|nr:hypothetical protein GIB67_005674 [Kingdonia uniflora]
MKGKGGAAGNYFVLNTGAKIPAIGLGTWQSGGDLCIEAVKTALDTLFLSFVYCLRLCRIRRLFMGLRPDQFTLASVLKACSAISEGFHIGKQIHVHALKMGSGEDDFVSTTLIDVYGKSGRMKEAELLFSRSDGFDLVSWNAMMAGYVTNQDGHKALNLFSTIQKSGEKSNQFTLTTALNACSCLVAFQQGKQIHGYLVLNLINVLSSGILDIYVKCGDVSGASLAFDSICEPDIVTWTTMISGCVENGEKDRSLGFYHRMMCLGVSPDEYGFATLIKACSCLTALEQGRQIHANAIKLECTFDQFVGTLLVDMHSKCGSIQESYKLFKRMNVRNIASRNAMVVGLAQYGNGEEALNFFKQMRCQDIKPDSITFIGVLSACSHSGLVSEAYGYFNSMHSMYGIEPKIEHYSCLVDVLGRVGHVHQAKKLIESMPFEPSASMFRALLGPCKLQGDAETGEYVATRLLVLEPFNSAAYVLLSNIYALAIQWDKVKETRKMMKSRSIKKDLGYSWIDVKSKVHLFVVDDKSHPQASAIYDKLEKLIQIIGKEGYTPDTDYVMHDVEEEEKERSLYYHSERLAIAYGIIILLLVMLATDPPWKSASEYRQFSNRLKPTWKVMEALVKSGLVRTIGVSNFSVRQIEELLQFANIVPAVNQVELHPFWRQDELVKFCQLKGIHVSAHTPLGVPVSTKGMSDSGSGSEDEPGTPRITFMRSKSVHSPMLKLSVVAKIAERRKKTSEHIIL